ncbi:hypothetical protein EDC04DRAFT_2604564 [Pisolithus marmoratus]|nr:hypothetical protein EDC04DRAFT_2604564 [Pisolithus marmoratus]
MSQTNIAIYAVVVTLSQSLHVHMHTVHMVKERLSLYNHGHLDYRTMCEFEAIVREYFVGKGSSFTTLLSSTLSIHTVLMVRDHLALKIHLAITLFKGSARSKSINLSALVPRFVHAFSSYRVQTGYTTVIMNIWYYESRVTSRLGAESTMIELGLLLEIHHSFLPIPHPTMLGHASPNTGRDISSRNLSALITLITNLELNATDAETLASMLFLRSRHEAVSGLPFCEECLPPAPSPPSTPIFEDFSAPPVSIHLTPPDPSNPVTILVHRNLDCEARVPSLADDCSIYDDSLEQSLYQMSWARCPLIVLEGLEPSGMVLTGLRPPDNPFQACELSPAKTALALPTKRNDSFFVCISEPSADSSADLHTRILRNRRIPSSQHAPASKRASKHGVAGSVGSVESGQILEQSALGATTNKPKPRRAVQPPEGWEEHMFGLRDRRRSLTPHVSATKIPVLPSPSQHQVGQVYNEDTEMDEMEEDTNVNVDEPKSSSEQDKEKSSGGQDEEKSSGEQDEQKTSTEEDDRSSNYNESEDSSSNYDDKELRHPFLSASIYAYASLTRCSYMVLIPMSEQFLVTSHRFPHPCHRRTTLMTSDPDGEETVPPPRQGHQMYPKLQNKGKGRALDVEDVDVADNSDCEAPPPNFKKPGKPVQNGARRNSGICEGSDRDAVNNLITKEREKLKAVYEWSESSSIVPTNRSVKSIAARVENAKTQFSGLAEAWSNLEDIEIVGAVMYIGQDPAGRQTSGIFGGSEAIRNFINDNSIDVRALLDKYTAIFKCLRNGDGVDAGLETSRDRNRRVFGSMMKEKLLAALRNLHLTHGIEVSDPQKVGWHQLLEFMRKCHLTVVNWPLGVSPLGPGFDHKKLKAGPLRQLIVPYLRRKLGPMYDGQTDDEEEQDGLDDAPEIEIKCWSQDIINISDNNPLSGDVPLVKAADGTVLRKVSDDPEWQKSCQERDRQQQQDAERPRVEVLNDDSIPCQSGHQGPPRDEGQDARPIALDLRPNPSLIPTGARTREPDPSDFPAPVPGYRVGFYSYLYDKAKRSVVQDPHHDMFPGRTHTREPGPSQQPLPRRREDSRNDRANYRDPSPSNIPYNAPPPAHYNHPPPSRQGYRIPSRTDHRVYHDGPYTNEYYPTAWPAAPCWVNRGGTTQQYEDDFPGDYCLEANLWLSVFGDGIIAVAMSGTAGSPPLVPRMTGVTYVTGGELQCTTV